MEQDTSASPGLRPLTEHRFTRYNRIYKVMYDQINFSILFDPALSCIQDNTAVSYFYSQKPFLRTIKGVVATIHNIVLDNIFYTHTVIALESRAWQAIHYNNTVCIL